MKTLMIILLATAAAAVVCFVGLFVDFLLSDIRIDISAMDPDDSDTESASGPQESA